MKFPKYRANIYVVVREDNAYGSGIYNCAILGTFSDPVEADNFKDACSAEWFDKKLPPGSLFDVRLSTYYG